MLILNASCNNMHDSLSNTCNITIFIIKKLINLHIRKIQTKKVPIYTFYLCTVYAYSKRIKR